MDVVETAVGRALAARARDDGSSLDALADRLGLDAQEVSDLLTGERAVDLPLAEGLADLLGGTAEEWLAIDDRAPRVARWLDALDQFGTASLRALRERGYVSATRNQPGRLADELDAFFDCDPEEFAAVLGASFRQSGAYVVHNDAVRVWLRLAEDQAAFVVEQASVPSLDTGELKDLLLDLAAVGDDEPSVYLPTVRERLADVGVALVVQPDVQGSRLSGAAWVTGDGQGVVALTLRHGTDDFFWWDLFHECAHLLLGHGLFVDVNGESESSHEEDEADELARSLLAPDVWRQPATRPREADLQAEASRTRVPVGVFVGQWQRRGLVEPWEMRGLKRPTPKAASLEVRPTLGPRAASSEQAVAELLRVARAS